MSRRPAEIEQELEALQESLKSLMEREGAIYLIDFKYFSQIIGDLKQELRIARAKE